MLTFKSKLYIDGDIDKDPKNNALEYFKAHVCSGFLVNDLLYAVLFLWFDKSSEVIIIALISQKEKNQ